MMHFRFCGACWNIAHDNAIRFISHGFKKSNGNGLRALGEITLIETVISQVVANVASFSSVGSGSVP